LPRRPIGHRAKKWEIKTHPDLSSEALASRHPVSSAEIKRAYDALDRVTQQVARILDKYGVMANFRIIYRAYAEELWRLTTTFTGATLGTSANAVSVKYQGYGSDTEILTDIAKLFGLSVSFVAGGVGTHNLLSAIHPDTLVGSPVAGDLIYANATPKWARFPIGSNNRVLKILAGALSWSEVDWSELTGKPSTYPPSSHGSSHENTGTDEISVEGLSGLLGDPQTPEVHGIDKHSQFVNRLADVVPVASIWDVDPTNLAYSTDEDWGTVTGTGSKVLGSAGNVGRLIFDMGAVYKVLVRGLVGIGNNYATGADGFLFLAVSSDNVTYLNVGDLYSRVIHDWYANYTRNCFFGHKFARARYLRFTWYGNAGATWYGNVTELEAIDLGI